MNAAAAINILTVLAGVDKPAFEAPEGYWSRGKYAPFGVYYVKRRDAIAITRPMLADITNEHELAFLLGHELGHRALNHGFMQMAFHRQDCEKAADAYAVRLLSGKGYDLAKILLWFDRRIAAQQGGARRKMSARKAAILNIIEGV